MRFRLITGALALTIALFAASGDAGFPKVPKVKKKPAQSVDVDQFLARVEATKTNFQGATKCLKQGRDILFDIAATKEKKEQLNTMQRQLDEAESEEEKERITIEMGKAQDEEIKRAKESGELENKKLNQEQAGNVGKLSFNLALAIILDRNAVEHGPKIISDGQLVIDNAKSNPMHAAKLGAKLPQVTKAVTTDIPAIINEAPHQIETLNALLDATKVLRKNNDIPDKGEPKESDQFEEVDF